MTISSTSLKAKIKNLSNESGVSAQVILQNYMFERFLERIAKSRYKENFILKGGVLVASMVGINKRSTMDMDATMKGYPLNLISIEKFIKEICNVNFMDNCEFNYKNIHVIRKDSIYEGFRVGIISKYDSIITPLKIDITTGDKITPREIYYPYKTLFGENSIDIFAYNIESILAEKAETILSRGVFSTRPRDFYDIFVLTKTQSYDKSTFSKAFHETSSQRGSTHVFQDLQIRIDELHKSESLKSRWDNYSVEYSYANNISYIDIISALKELLSPLLSK